MPQTQILDDFSSYPLNQSYGDGQSFGNWPWTSIFNGGGTNQVSPFPFLPLVGNPTLRLTPSFQPNDTRSALVASPSFQGDFLFRSALYTRYQLRGVEANAWEVAWLVWNYQYDPGLNFHYFYYLVLKPKLPHLPFGGWEIGKRDPKYIGPNNDGQKVLFTGSNPRSQDGGFPIQQWYTVQISVKGPQIAFWVNDLNQSIFHGIDPDPLPQNEGGIGFYTEDADVCFDNALLVTP